MKHPVTKSWQLYDGKACGSIVTINNRIISAPSAFKRYVGQLLPTLPLTTKVTKKEYESTPHKKQRRNLIDAWVTLKILCAYFAKPHGFTKKYVPREESRKIFKLLDSVVATMAEDDL